MKTFNALALALTAAVAAIAQSAPAAAQPAADYTLRPAETFKSPDGATIVEQYVKDDPGGGYLWQFWARRGDTLALLNAEPADYPAGFRFTNDSRWLVRMQKTGAGYSDVLLYRLGPQGFVPATKGPLSELAWAYYKRHRDARRLGVPDYHIAAGLVKGTDENYRWLGVRWPDSRYIVIGLSGEIEAKKKPGKPPPGIGDWRVRYDLKTGKFDVPPALARNNAAARRVAE